VPERLDLAVRPGRVDLGPDVADRELGKAALEPAEHRAGDRDERRPVVGHELVRHPAQLDRLLEQGEDPDRLLRRDGADPEEEPAVVVDEGDEVAGPCQAGRPDEVERALEIDVPELVGGGALVVWAGRPDVARPVRPVASEDAVDLAVGERPHLAPPELGGDPPAVPVGQQADGEDEPLDRRRQVAPPANARTVKEPREPIALEARAPAEQAGPAAPELGAERGQRDAVCPTPEGGPASPHDGRKIPEADAVRWSPALRRHEQEARTLLVVVPAR
jgi:hypothetical protein